jgi:iron complex outermembrane receptor protein
VLVAIAAQTQRPISFDAGLTRNYKSAGVSGRFTVEQAIKSALTGTPLELMTTPGGALTVRAKPGGPPQAGADATGAALLPQITVDDTASKANVTSFTASNSSSATLTDTPVSDTPMSVQTVTQGQMRSQQVQSVQDALSNVSGVSISQPSGVGQSAVSIRGFVAPVAADGLVSPVGSSYGGSASGLSIPVIGIDRIDVVKGADAIVGAGTNPGGVVNVIRKRPQADPTYEVQMQTGSYGEFLLGADAGGAISKENNLNYRFVVSADRTGETYGGSIGQRELYLAPSIGYKTANTDLVVGFEQNTQHLPVPSYTVAINGAPAHVPYPIGNAESHERANTSTLYYDFTQKLSPNWSVKSKASYSASVLSFYDTEGDLLDDLGDAVYIPITGSIHERQWNFLNTVEGKFNTGPLKHDLVLGVGYQKSLISNGVGADAANIGFGNIFLPTAPAEDAIPTTQTSEIDSYSNQIFLQDQLTYQRLHVLASITHAQAWSPSDTGVETASEWTPNFGVLYQLTGDIGAYASYTKSFIPQATALLVGGGSAPPARGKAVEVGLKGNFLDDRLTSSVALFRSQTTNALVADALLPGYSTLSPSGYVTRGVEVDASGQIAPGLRVTGNYTYNDQQHTLGPGEPAPALLPRHNLHIWFDYAFQSTPLQGFSVGGGVTVSSSYQAGLVSYTQPPFRLPGQASTDASVSYKYRKLTTTFGIKNIFNHTLYGQGATNEGIYPEAGRTFLLTSIYQF